MGERKTTPLRMSGLGILLSVALTTTAFGGERGVTFSGYVPERYGDLSFGPKQAYAESFGSSAALQLIAGNAGSSTSQILFEAFDSQFNDVNDIALPRPASLLPGETRRFLFVVPIMQDVARRVRICATLRSPIAKAKRQCGKYIARNR